jgi:4-carboxymuconolactone decarboxylase
MNSHIISTCQQRPMTPRIPPAAIDELDDDGRALLASVDNQGTGATNVFRTLVRNKGLFRYFIPYGGKLLRGKLPPRLRELMILRLAHQCRCPYEWNQHSKLARSVGISHEEIVATRADLHVSSWSDHDRAVLRAVDELHSASTISTDLWNELARLLSDEQLIEIPLLVGHFTGVAYLLNSLNVEMEDRPEERY